MYAAIKQKVSERHFMVTETYSLSACFGTWCSTYVMSLLPTSVTRVGSVVLQDWKNLSLSQKPAGSLDSQITTIGKRCFQKNWRKSQRRYLNPRVFYWSIGAFEICCLIRIESKDVFIKYALRKSTEQTSKEWVKCVDQLHKSSGSWGWQMKKELSGHQRWTNNWSKSRERLQVTWTVAIVLLDSLVADVDASPDTAGHSYWSVGGGVRLTIVQVPWKVAWRLPVHA